MTNLPDPFNSPFVPSLETQLNLLEREIADSEAIEREFAFMDERNKPVPVISAAEWEAREILALEPIREKNRKRILRNLKLTLIFWIGALAIATVAVAYVGATGPHFSWSTYITVQLLWVAVAIPAFGFFENYFGYKNRLPAHL